MTSNPRLLMLSHVPPFPRTSGQRQRVYYTLLALRDHFDVTLCLDADAASEASPYEMETLCDEIIVLPRRRPTGGVIGRAAHAGIESAYSIATGLKRSNYKISRDFAFERIADAVDIADFDIVYFQYWHAVSTAAPFREHGTLTVVDLHDVLWRSRQLGLERRSWVPAWYRRSATRRYRKREEAGWRCFDVLIAINAAEQRMLADAVPGASPWYVPMGIRLEDWSARYSPVAPARIAYFGGITSDQREAEVLRAAQGVMPGVWKESPDTELWIIGNGPGERIRDLGRDPRITVTGFVDDVGGALGGATAVLCPFEGTYGFRSRLIEVLATGVPVIATADAVWGMGLGSADGVLVGHSDDELAAHCLRVLEDPELRRELSERGAVAAQRFGFDETYVQLANRLADCLTTRRSISRVGQSPDRKA